MKGMAAEIRLVVLALAAIISFNSCSTQLGGVVGDVFGQPNGYSSLKVDLNLPITTTISVDTRSYYLKSPAVAVRGTLLSLTKRTENANCFTSSAQDLIYCKFGDLTPYSNASISYIGNTTSAKFAYLDVLNNTQLETLK